MMLPQILLLIPPQHLPVIADEVRHIHQSRLIRHLVTVILDDSARHDADVVRSRQGAVLVKVDAPLRAEAEKVGGEREPIG